MSMQEKLPEKRPFGSHLPGVREIGGSIITLKELRGFLARAFHMDGRLNPDGAPLTLREAMKHADTHDLDVILSQSGDKTVVYMGRWIVNNKRLIEIGAIAAVTAATAIAGIGAGIILRKHKRESSQQK